MILNRQQLTQFPDGMIMYKDVMPTSNLSCSIRNFNELMMVGQAIDVINREGIIPDLSIHYLVGSRMDRPMDKKSPNTLKVVCDVINNWNVRNLNLVWSHSQSALDRLEATADILSEVVFIRKGLKHLLEHDPQDVFTADGDWALCLPDAGAAKRYWNDHHSAIGIEPTVIECSKHRHMKTGKLTGFSCPSEVPLHCIIVDDIADGAGTFSGLAGELKKNGAKRVDLIVYHGIFSKGQSVPNIDNIYTSNSFRYDLKTSSSFFVNKVI